MKRKPALLPTLVRDRLVLALKQLAVAGAAAALPLMATKLSVAADSLPDAGRLLRELELSVPAPPTERPANIELPQTPQPARSTTQDNAARFMLRGVRIEGNATQSEPVFDHIVADYLGREVGLDELNALAQRITQHYRQAGYLVARAYLPPQEVHEGMVEIRVLEGLLGERHIGKSAGLRTEVTERLLRPLKSGTVLQQSEIERLALLGADVPGVASASATLKPGAQTGESDVELNLEAERKLTGTLEVDNYGSDSVGEERLSAQVQMANPGGWGELLGLRLVSSGEGLNSGRLNVQFTPLPHGWKAGMSAGYTQYELGERFGELDARGRARAFGLFALYPIVRAQRWNLYAQMLGEYKDLQDSVLDINTEKHASAFTLLLAGDYRDRWLAGGVSSYTLSLTGGRLGIETPGARALDAATARSDGSYGKLGLSFLRLQQLSERWALYAGASAQWANKNLDSSEKFALGGPNGVRAYPQGEAIGDRGYLATLEVRYRVPRAVLGGATHASLHYDQGEVRINARPWVEAEDKARRLSGAGVGLGWTHGDGWAVRLQLARRLSGKARSDEDRGGRAWVQVQKRF